MPSRVVKRPPSVPGWRTRSISGIVRPQDSLYSCVQFCQTGEKQEGRKAERKEGKERRRRRSEEAKEEGKTHLENVPTEVLPVFDF